MHEEIRADEGSLNCVADESILIISEQIEIVAETELSNDIDGKPIDYRCKMSAHHQS